MVIGNARNDLIETTAETINMKNSTKRLMELAGMPTDSSTQLLTENEVPEYKQYRSAIDTIASYVVNEIYKDEKDEIDIDDIMEGRWIEVLRDEIYDCIVLNKSSNREDQAEYERESERDSKAEDAFNNMMGDPDTSDVNIRK